MNVKLNALDLTSFDEKTGEVIEGRPGCPFRSLTDNKGYFGIEHVDPDLPSETICNGYQSIKTLYERCMRLPPVGGDFDGFSDADISDDEAFDYVDDEDDLERVSQIYDQMTTPVSEQSSKPTQEPEKVSAVDDKKADAVTEE